MEHLALKAFFLIPFLESLPPLRDLIAPTAAPRISLILNLHIEVLFFFSWAITYQQSNGGLNHALS